MKVLINSVLILVVSYLLIGALFSLSTNNAGYTDSDYLIISKHLNVPQILYDYPSAKKYYENNLYLVEQKKFNGIYFTNNINHRATLGRVLFYDKNISIDSSISCSSCHIQKFAFSDTVMKSNGVNKNLTYRNSMALAVANCISCAYNDLPLKQGFSWTNEINNISDQIKKAIVDTNEMGSKMSIVIKRLSSKEYYNILFRKAYPEHNSITELTVLESLATFVNSISSTDTKFDRGYVISNSIIDTFSNFSVSENRGKDIFNKDCLVCHGNTMGIRSITRSNNGLKEYYGDIGAGEYYDQNLFDNVFKVPFLRNIGFSGPYMHDGRFSTLREVILHYNSGMVTHPNLSFKLRNSKNQAKKFNYTRTDINDILNFLNTLNDSNVVKNIMYSNPFK